MLRAYGYDQSFEDWIPALDRFQIADQAVSCFADAASTSSFLSSIVRAMADPRYRDSEEHQARMRWNEAYNAVAPLLRAVQEFLRLSEYASASSVNLRTPVYRLSANLMNLAPQPSDSDAVFVYRITTDKLGVVPICHTLRAALEISRHPDAIALRQKMAQWLSSLASDRADLTKRIQNDINSASRSLLRANKLEKIGEVTGYLSMATSFAAIVAPLLGAVGLTLTCVAVFSDQLSYRMKDRVRWVGFGSSRVLPANQRLQRTRKARR